MKDESIFLSFGFTYNKILRKSNKYSKLIYKKKLIIYKQMLNLWPAFRNTLFQVYTFCRKKNKQINENVEYQFIN